MYYILNMSGQTEQNIQLFGSMNFSSNEHIELFMEQLDVNSSIYCLVEAVKYAHARGSFSIGETELLSRSIRTISKNQK